MSRPRLVIPELDVDVPWTEATQSGRSGDRRMGRGYRVSFTLGQDRTRLPLVLPVNGSDRFHSAELQDEAFAPGSWLSFRRQPDNPYDPNAVMVFDAGGRLHIGYVPAEHASLVVELMEHGVNLRAQAIWEWLSESGTRTHIRMLVYEQSESAT